MKPTPTALIRYAVATATAVSGYVHADLYVHGYRYLHWIGPMFLLQSAGSFSIALLLLVAGAPVLRLGAAGLAAGALAGFVLSRTVGILGFTEHGWQPAPQAVLTVLTESTSLLLLGYLTWRTHPRDRANSADPSHFESVALTRSTTTGTVTVTVRDSSTTPR